MRKTFFLLFVMFVLLAIIGFTMMSCGVSNPFLGTWSGILRLSRAFELEFTFTADNTGSYRQDAGDSFDFTYTYKGKEATLLDEYGNAFATAAITGTSISLFIPEENTTIILTKRNVVQNQPTIGADPIENHETLYLYNWNDYTPFSVIQKFESEFSVKVVVDEYASNEEMYTKLRTGATNYDLVFPSQDYVSIMIRQDMLEKLDKSLIGNNIRNIDPAVLEKTIYDPSMDYSVPYYWGVLGIIVRVSRVPNYERSWSTFGRSDLRNRMTMLDDLRRVMGTALSFLGYSVNSKNPAEIEAAANLINTQWKPNLTKFDSDFFGKGYANGEFWVVQGRAEVVYREIADEGQILRDTVVFIPQNSPAFIDSMCIPKGAKNKELAHKFIGFIHQPEIYAEFCGYLGLPVTVNVPARQFTEGPFLYGIEALTGKELLYDIGDALDLYNDVWFNSIRASR